MSVASGPRDGAPEPPVVPGYVLEELLGRGGSGEVWRAVPRGGGDPVAIKLLVAGDPERQAREAALLGALDHPHLVRLREVVHQPRRGDSPRVALVLDLLAGGSLAALLAARRRLRPGEVVTALAPVAAALAHAHVQGVVHGDLSPGNIVFTAVGRPVLTDLGVARVLGEHGSAAVTPAYVDPSVARGGAPGPASDVFGVAAAAFHALTGIPPWNAAGPEGTLAVAAAGELPDLAELAPDAPEELRAVILRGLSVEPGARGSAAAFALDLRHACRPEPVRLPTSGTAPEELARTGAARRTELTHQVPGRRAVPEEQQAAARPGRRRLPRPRLRAPRSVLLVLLVVGVAAAGWLGVRSAGTRAEPRPPAAAPGPAAATGVPPRREPPPSPGSTTSTSASTSATADAAVADRQEQPPSAAGWQRVVEELYARRARAFTEGSPAPLADVYVPGSALLAADAEHLAALGASGRVLRGFTPAVTAVVGARVTGDRVELRLSDGWGAYDVVAAGEPSGRALAREPARPTAPAVMVLRRTGAGWRIETARREG